MMLVFLIVLALGLLVYFTGGLFFLTGLFLPKKARSTVQPFVSVIIAARNEETYIRRCLNSVVDQSYSSLRYEIIVVNDRSNDRTGEIVAELTNRYPHLTLLNIDQTPEGYSPKKWALQKAVEQSRGEILLFTDADCVVPYYWIETMVRYFDEKTGMVIGYSSMEAGTIFEKLQSMDFLALMSCACGSCNLGLPLSGSGQNLAYRRAGFDAVGGFHPVMKRISGDDVLMIQLFRRRTNWKIVFSTDPASFVKTRPAGNWKELMHQRTRWASNAPVMLRLNSVFLIYLAGVYLFHLALGAGVFWFGDYLMRLPWLIGIDPALLPLLIFAVFNKLCIDLMVILNGSRLFRQPFSLTIFLLWFITQTPYVLWVGFRGAFGLFRWK